MKEVTKQWIEFAKSDIICSKESLSNIYLTNIVAFHSQQAVEKCFKAVLEENGVKLPRIHNLVRLYALIKDFIPFSIDLDELTTLDEVYTTSRYPGEYGIMPHGKPGKDEAERMYLYAKYVYDNTIDFLEENNNKQY